MTWGCHCSVVFFFVFDRRPRGEESVQLAVIEGARVGSDKPLKKHARRGAGTHWNLFGTKGLGKLQGLKTYLMVNNG